MTFPKVRAVVAACLFLAWLGLLLFLVLERKSVILSRPQFLIAQTIMVVELQDAKVIVKEVLWPKSDQTPKLDLAHWPDFGNAPGYHGAGVYLVPLLKREGGYSILPRPWFGQGPPLPSIYPWNDETRAQVEEIIAAKDRE